MIFPARVAILLDGEFAKRALQKGRKRFPAAEDVMAEVRRLLSTDLLRSLELYRVFYYTADPLTGSVTHPLSRQPLEFGATETYSRNARLIASLEVQADVAVRRGTLAHQGWEIGKSAVRALVQGSKVSIEPGDIVPKVQQKGVDMRIGLVTGDSDLVPAMKLARREGLRVYLDTLGSLSVRAELKIHADQLL
jgi:uncharacterized LabA/DUF88 family protein